MKNNKISLLALALILSNTISPTDAPKVAVDAPVKPSRLSNVMSHLGAHKGKYGAAATATVAIAAGMYNDLHNKLYNYYVSTSDIKDVSATTETPKVKENGILETLSNHKVAVGITAAIGVIGSSLLYFIKNKNTSEDSAE